MVSFIFVVSCSSASSLMSELLTISLTRFVLLRLTHM